MAQLSEGSWGEALLEVGDACSAQVGGDADFNTWQKVRAAQKGRAKKRVLGGPKNPKYGAGPNSGPVRKKPSHNGHNNGAYKACSKPSIAVGVRDNAECSGNPHTFDGEDGFCWHNFYNGSWQMHQNLVIGQRLAWGCIVHDICLQSDDWKRLQGFSNGMYYKTCYGCDAQLADHAFKCMHNTGGKCNDSWFQAYKVRLGMGFRPNRLFDDRGCGCTETCCGGYMGNGSYEGWCCPGGGHEQNG